MVGSKLTFCLPFRITVNDFSIKTDYSKCNVGFVSRIVRFFHPDT